jgi:hypothetical protein
MGLKTKNNAAGTLASGITNSATSITLTATHGARFPTLGASDYFYGTLADASNNLEIVKVTARSGDVLTVVRGQDGTTGLAYSAGDRFELRPCNAMMEAIDQEALDPVIGSGTDTYTGNLDPVPNGYNTDQIYFVKFPNANTSTTPTLNLNSYGAKTIKRTGGVALVPGDIKANMVGMLHYDGTDMNLLNPYGGGKQAIPIPAVAITPRSANGCGALTFTAGAANQPDVPYLPFDGAAKEYAGFLMRMPKGWDEGPVTAAFSWRRASGTGAANVVWGIRAVAVSDNETPAVAFGSDATVTDAASTTTANMNVSGETGPCTIGGTPVEGDLVFFEVFRDGAAAGDTLDAVDAWLTEATLFITMNQPNDA